MKTVMTFKALIILTLISINGYGQTPVNRNAVKRVLVEEQTGTWCASCGFGAVYFKHVEDKYPNAIPVAIHTGPGGQDPMAILSIEIYMSSYYSGAPTFMFDRTDFPENPGSKASISASNPWEFGLDTLDKYMDMVYNQSPLATVGITQSYNPATREITATITGDFIQNTTGNFRLNCFILEDSVTGGPEYDQANSNFSGWTGGPPYLQELIDETHPIVGYSHNHVLRAMLGNPEGATASIPTTVTAGSSYSNTFTYVIPADFDEKQISLVGLVQKYGADKVSQRQVVNANSQHLQLSPVSVSEINQDFINLTIYPNPVTNQSTIEFHVIDQDQISCELINSSGEIVKTMFNQFFTPGDYKINFDGVNLSNGMYFLRFTNSQTTLTKKFIVNKQ